MGGAGQDPAIRDVAALALQRLRDAGIIETDAVTVRVTEGVAYLQGTVGNHRRKREAEQVLAGTPGILAVVNELRVVPQMPRSDEQILADVQAVLATCQDCCASPIVADVREGAITLTGVVGSLRERTAAEECAWSVRGVREVRNLLTVGTGVSPSDTTLAQELAALLAEYLGITERQLEVTVYRGIAYLHGTVPTEEHRGKAEEAVRLHRQIVDVVNQLEVLAGLAQVSHLPPGVPVNPALVPNIFLNHYRSGLP